MFQYGIIPSDTDFRIWRDFGNFHGKNNYLLRITYKVQCGISHLVIQVDKTMGNRGIVAISIYCMTATLQHVHERHLDIFT